jgi:Lrp/AsnC family leucine-responsive transcriptional regulator
VTFGDATSAGALALGAGDEEQVSGDLGRGERSQSSRWSRQLDAQPAEPVLHTAPSLGDMHVAIISRPMNAEAGDSGNRSLDETDVRILRMLEANGRASYEEMARFVNLSANAVRGRVQSLIRRRVIRGIHADIDWTGGGPKIEALIDVRLRPGADDAAFEEAALAIPGAVVLEHLAGPTHYQLRVAVGTTEAIDDVIRRLKEELRVESTNTKIVTRAERAD